MLFLLLAEQQVSPSYTYPGPTLVHEVVHIKYKYLVTTGYRSMSLDSPVKAASEVSTIQVWQSPRNFSVLLNKNV